MIRTMFLLGVVLTVALAAVPGPVLAQETTVSVSAAADATVRVICRNDFGEELCLVPRGTDTPDGMNPAFPDDPADEFIHHRYVSVYDQNSSDVGYWQFDLSAIPVGATVISAKFQLDSQTNSWADTAVNVIAIADPDKDWDLNALPESEINGQNAPLVDVDAFPWTGDDAADGQQRFNAPLPFLEEGESPADTARVLVPFPDFLLIENEDPFTEDGGNAYGGLANEGGAGTGGSADYGLDVVPNIWPVKDAIDLDITELVKWKLGQNAAWSDFDPKDAELTLMVRTELGEGGTNGFVRFISKESVENADSALNPDFTLNPDGVAALEPGRIVVTYEGGLMGDFDGNGVLDLPDVNMLSAEVFAGTNDVTFDLNADNLVHGADLTVWVKDLRKTWFGDANLDGEFTSADLVGVLAAGKFGAGEDAGWDEGDWNGDLRFNSADVVKALADGGFDAGPLVATAAVPEPSSLVILTVLSLGLMLYRRS